jgi:hypothetical protein
VFITDITIEMPAEVRDDTRAIIQYNTYPLSRPPATHRQITVGPFTNTEGHRLVAIPLDDEKLSMALGRLEVALRREADHE